MAGFPLGWCALLLPQPPVLARCLTAPRACSCPCRCGPCQMMGKILDEVAPAMRNRVKIVKVGAGCRKECCSVLLLAVAAPASALHSIQQPRLTCRLTARSTRRWRASTRLEVRLAVATLPCAAPPSQGTAASRMRTCRPILFPSESELLLPPALLRCSAANADPVQERPACGPSGGCAHGARPQGPAGVPAGPALSLAEHALLIPLRCTCWAERAMHWAHATPCQAR